MFFRQVELSTALRPALLADETLLFVQDGVGLYQGSTKIPSCQQGYGYLTSLRFCYVDEQDPRQKSVALDLQDVDRVEYQTGFLRTSPKIILYSKSLRPNRSSAPHSSSRDAGNGDPASPTHAGTISTRRPQLPPSVSTLNATWVCPICSFSNLVPPKFDPSMASASTPLPSCQACGIKPPLSVLLKAAIGAVKRAALPRKYDPPRGDVYSDAANQNEQAVESSTTIACPRCTFLNDMHLPVCELCGAPLKNNNQLTSNDAHQMWQAESPGPRIGELHLDELVELDTVKISFRTGGDKTFYERLQGAMTQRNWLLVSAPPVPKPAEMGKAEDFKEGSTLFPSSAITRPTSAPVGIAGLERRGFENRKNNEVVIGTAFEDLEALMASAKDIVALAESFAVESRRGSVEASSVFSESAAALGMVTTKDKLDSGSENLYLAELSRNLAEYLTDDRKGVLRLEGGIISLIDLWALFNRSRNGMELVSPLDFQKAARLWEKLALPVRLRRFKSGLLVVQRSDWSDEKTISQLGAWLQELHLIEPAGTISWEWRRFGRGVDAQETAQRFGWSVGVASEELEMAEDRGVVCREEGIEGLRFWSNHLIEE